MQRMKRRRKEEVMKRWRKKEENKKNRENRKHPQKQLKSKTTSHPKINKAIQAIYIYVHILNTWEGT